MHEQLYLYPIEWQCDYRDNLEFAEGVCRSVMPIFVKVKITAINNIINCLIFSFRPPQTYPQGNEAYPVAMNLNHDQFKRECIIIFREYKNKSLALYEKLIDSGYYIDHDTEIVSKKN